MEKLSLLIVTDDKEYGRALGQALLYICSRIFVQIMGKEEFFSKKQEREASEDAAPFLKSVDLILWDGEEAEDAYGGSIILLSGKPVMASKNFRDKKFCIYKYSQAQSIAASLFEIYSFLAGRQTANILRHQVRVLAFSSCSGGTGCTVLSMAVAQELCRFGDKKVMYISFEETESTGEFMGNSAGVKGVGVYLYHLFKNESSIVASKGYADKSCPAIESYIIHDDFGLEAFSPTEGRNPLSDLNDEELDIFVGAVIDSGRYDVVILDLGNSLSKVNLSCLEMAEKICFVSKPERKHIRENQYLQHLMRCCGESVMNKLIKIENMVPKSDKDDADKESSAMIDTEIYIRKSSTFLQEGEIKRIFLDGSFGQDIKELTKKLIEEHDI